MSVSKDGKFWRCQFYYKDWQGERKKKNKRGFRTKNEAEQWERDFRQQHSGKLSIRFDNFVETYMEDMKHRLREHTMINKEYIINLKIVPYFKNRNIKNVFEKEMKATNNEFQNISRQFKSVLAFITDQGMISQYEEYCILRS